MLQYIVKICKCLEYEIWWLPLGVALLSGLLSCNEAVKHFSIADEMPVL